MRPGIEGIPADYDPRYPRTLDPAEYEERIAPDQRQRLLAAAAAAASLACTPSGAPQTIGKEADRVETVLRVLTSGGVGDSHWFSGAAFQRRKDRQGNPTVLPFIPIMFGNSMSGLFDANRARALTRELFLAYGLAPFVDHRLEEGEVQATIDLYDPKRRVGVELRGSMPKQNGMFASPSAEPPAAALDDAEHARLAAGGSRVQCVDLASFEVMDGDGATATLAYLAGIVEFLNEVAGGPAIDLTAILSGEKGRITLPEPRLDPGVRLAEARAPWGSTYEADAASAITYSIDPAPGYERTTPQAHGYELGWSAAEPGRPGSSPLLLQIHASPAAALTVEQDGARPLRVEAAGSLAFLPAHFDPSRPFRVTLRLEPGKSRVVPHLVLYGLAR